MTLYPNLLSPKKVGAMEFKNRLVMAPMSRGRATEKLTANELMAEYYSARSSAGLIITEGTHTSILGRGWFHTPEVFKPEHAKGWKIVTDRVHECGGLIFCQLWHAGRTSHSAFRDGEDGFEGDLKLSVAPSAIKKHSESGKQMHTPRGGEVDVETPREMTKDEVEALPEEYRNAAQTAKDGGFDGVEVHCAGGFLLDTFLDACSNKRNDEYGGSYENRFRIIEKIMRAVFTVFEPDRVSVKISPNSNYNGMGSEDFREAYLYYVDRFAKYGLAYLHVTIGVEFGFHGFGEPMTMADLRKVYPGVMMANMGYDAASGEKEIADGNADLICMGRTFLSNPDYAERIADGRDLNPLLPFPYWYSSKEKVWTTEGYTDLSVLEESK